MRDDLTDGFRDTIEIGRQHRALLYDPYQTKPKPLIKRRYRYSINERIDVKGAIVRPLDTTRAREIAATIKQHGIQSVAIAFINSYVNAAHENAMRDIVLELNPGIYCVTSADTRPVFREHGRFTTTAIRAATIPVMERYFARLEATLAEAGFGGRLMILKSSGGITGVDYAKNHPEELIESGPAGGVAYAAYLSELKGDCPNIIHTDVGGTSFDVSIVENGKGLVTRDHEIEWEIPVIVPMLDIHSVGAGGGSMGWIDEGGSLRVGPQSAGASPGPACYGQGGTEPTITDANLLLGRIEPTLGGKMELDRAAAEAAMERLAAGIGLSAIETADGMIRIGCENMAQAVKKVIVARGRDPRDFILASFGGAGAMHACFVADSMNIPRIIVPAQAGVASASAPRPWTQPRSEAFYFACPSPRPTSRSSTPTYAQLERRHRPARSRRRQAADVEFATVGPDALCRADLRSGDAHPERDFDARRPAADRGQFPSLSRDGVRGQFDDFAPAIVALGVTAVGRNRLPTGGRGRCLRGGAGEESSAGLF